MTGYATIRAGALIIGLILTLGDAAAAAAAGYSGNQLLAACEAPPATPNASLCMGYILGVETGLLLGAVDGLIVPMAKQHSLGTASQMNDRAQSYLMYCRPSEVDNQQIIDVVTKYLAENPAHRNEQARFLILKALQSAFPCR